MLEQLLPFWRGKLFVLVLLGFVCHLVDHHDHAVGRRRHRAHVREPVPAARFLHGHAVPITVVLLLILGGVFLLGFSEAVGVAIPLVAVFLVLNAVVIVVGLVDVVHHRRARCPSWTDALDRRRRRLRRRGRPVACWRSRCWCSACPGSRPGSA